MSTRSWLILLSVLITTGVVLVVFGHPRVSALFHQHVPDRLKRWLLLALIGFLVTFGVARTLAYVNFHHIGPFHDIYIRGRHVHHLVWGILVLLGMGFCWLIEVGTAGESSSQLASRLTSCLYGAGAALTLDEFALWLNLQDVYWQRQGRASIDAVVLFATLLSMGVWGEPFFKALGTRVAAPRKTQKLAHV